MDLGQKVRRGIESEPITAPDFTPIRTPERVETREPILVPIKR